jgi:ABC-type uncharacterized transport system permease subunit
MGDLYRFVGDEVRSRGGPGSTPYVVRYKAVVCAPLMLAVVGAAYLLILGAGWISKVIGE